MPSSPTTPWCERSWMPRRCIGCSPNPRAPRTANCCHRLSATRSRSGRRRRGHSSRSGSRTGSGARPPRASSTTRVACSPRCRNVLPGPGISSAGRRRAARSGAANPCCTGCGASARCWRGTPTGTGSTARSWSRSSRPPNSTSGCSECCAAAPGCNTDCPPRSVRSWARRCAPSRTVRISSRSSPSSPANCCPSWNLRARMRSRTMSVWMRSPRRVRCCTASSNGWLRRHRPARTSMNLSRSATRYWNAATGVRRRCGNWWCSPLRWTSAGCRARASTCCGWSATSRARCRSPRCGAGKTRRCGSRTRSAASTWATSARSCPRSGGRTTGCGGDWTPPPRWSGCSPTRLGWRSATAGRRNSAMPCSRSSAARRRRNSGNSTRSSPSSGADSWPRCGRGTPARCTPSSTSCSPTRTTSTR